MHTRTKLTIVIVIALVIIASYIAFVRKALNEHTPTIAKTIDDQVSVTDSSDTNTTSDSNGAGRNLGLITLGKSFTAVKGQTYTIAGAYRDTFQITEFYNVGPCPTGAQCLLPSGQAVYYSITTTPLSDPSHRSRTYDNRKETDAFAMPFRVTVLSSDYSTYATVVIQKK